MPKFDKKRTADALAAMTGAGNPNAPTRIEPDEPNAVDSIAADDDAVIVPVPAPSVFAPRRSTRDLAAERALHFKQTLIPVLLTCGVMLPAVASLKWLGGVDSPFAAWELWLVILLAMCGLVLFSLGMLNMIQVSRLLRLRKRPV